MKDARQTFREKGYLWNPLTQSYEKSDHDPLALWLSNSVGKRDPIKPLDNAPPNEEAVKQRYRVSFTRYAIRLLDHDNFVGGCKGALDQLRYKGLIPDDDLKSIETHYYQVEVKTKQEQGTMIRVERIVEV